LDIPRHQFGKTPATRDSVIHTDPAYPRGHSRKNLSSELDKGDGMSFGLYVIGFAILIAGLIYGAFLAHVPTHWIVVGSIVLLGVGILTGVKATRQKDSAE
jgi:hypothetical protein